MELLRLTTPLTTHVIYLRSLRAEARTFRGLRAINRGREIQYTQTRATRIRWFVDELIAGRLQGNYLVAKYDPSGFRLPDGTPIASDLHDGALPAGFADKLAALRTDLDRFTSVEALLLRYHGYWSAHARLVSLYPQLASGASPSWRDYAELSDSTAEGLGREIASGRGRRLRR